VLLLLLLQQPSEREMQLLVVHCGCLDGIDVMARCWLSTSAVALQNVLRSCRQRAAAQQVAGVVACHTPHTVRCSALPPFHR
jgi:hypothetical protein